MLTYQFRPIDQWPGKETSHYSRKRSQFSAAWSKTLDLLERELCFLAAKAIIIQADISLDMIKNDGMLRANATPRTPRVILSFESKHGPLSYPCDRFTHWQDNIRAIALALEALRSVDRYGVTRRAEQYKGWERIAGPVAGQMPYGEASTTLLSAAGIAHIPGSVTKELLEQIYRMAASRTHPDAGGDPETFKKVVAAKEALDKHFAGGA
jgi:hypothetical protein